MSLLGQLLKDYLLAIARPQPRKRSPRAYIGGAASGCVATFLSKNVNTTCLFLNDFPVVRNQKLDPICWTPICAVLS